MGDSRCPETLSGIDPKSRVLVASGGLNPAVRNDLKEAGAKGFINKPFDVPTA